MKALLEIEKFLVDRFPLARLKLHVVSWCGSLYKIRNHGTCNILYIIFFYDTLITKHGFFFNSVCPLQTYIHDTPCQFQKANYY